MNGDIYVRDGSRFKKVPNMVGMYYNGITFTKERMSDTIGVVVDQKYDHIVLCSNPSEHIMNWYSAKKWCEKQFDGKGRLPEIGELISAKKIIDHGYYWSSTEYGSYSAWHLSMYKNDPFGGVNGSFKTYDYSVVAFCDIPIINII